MERTDMITQEMLDDDQAFWCALLRMNMVPEHMFGQKESDRVGNPIESYRFVIFDVSDEKTDKDNDRL